MAIEENPFDHIFYEFSMYLQASLIRCNVQFVTNLLADSRMVHLRNIAYFFRSKEEKDRNKKYLHYSMFLSGKISREIDHNLFTRVQTVTSNAACHLLKGRLEASFKQKTILFEQEVFPDIVLMIREFILGLDERVCPDYEAAWLDNQIQRDAAEIMQLIHNCDVTAAGDVATATTD